MRRYLKYIAFILAIMVFLPGVYTPSFAEESAAEPPAEAEITIEMAEASAPESIETASEFLAEESTGVPTAETAESPISIQAADPAPTAAETPAETSAFFQPEADATTEEQAEAADAAEEETDAAKTEEASSEATSETTETEPAETVPSDPDEADAAETAETPSDIPSEASSASFEQQEAIGSTVITVTAPAGVFNGPLAIRETDDEAFENTFVEAVLAASQAKSNLIHHRLISLSGAEMNGTALVTFYDPTIAELISQYSKDKIKAYVYTYQPDRTRAKDRVKRIHADVDQDMLFFHITDVTVYGIMIFVKGQEPELPAEPSSEFTEEPTADPAESEAEDPDVRTSEEPTNTTVTVATENAPIDPFTVTVSGSYDGTLQYGSTIVLTAVFSVEDPTAVITWQYSPDGGETIYNVEGEHSNTLVYTFSEENADYSWRAAVYRTSEE